MVDYLEYLRGVMYMENIEAAGFKVENSYGRPQLRANVSKWPAIAPNVTVAAFRTLDEADAFARGAAWAKDFFRLSGMLKEQV